MSKKSMQIISNSAAQTMKIGSKIAKRLEKGDIICLFGDLGSGKTIFTKGLGRGLGITEKKIISPTFIFVREHKAKINLFHFDLYRLKDPEDISELGYEEYF
ncbi:MAG: tRNA (adenosine(37)-N6)-threonylcarbamoyltransferase complex ATPase subunit type 1 TsaE, partial [Candidatus Omnitrophota bacterium]